MTTPEQTTPREPTHADRAASLRRAAKQVHFTPDEREALERFADELEASGQRYFPERAKQAASEDWPTTELPKCARCGRSDDITCPGGNVWVCDDRANCEREAVTDDIGRARNFCAWRFVPCDSPTPDPAVVGVHATGTPEPTPSPCPHCPRWEARAQEMDERADMHRLVLKGDREALFKMLQRPAEVIEVRDTPAEITRLTSIIVQRDAMIAKLVGERVEGGKRAALARARELWRELGERLDAVEAGDG